MERPVLLLLLLRGVDSGLVGRGAAAALSLFLRPALLPTLTNAGDCVDMNYCNGHGTCQTKTDSCDCYEGWGAASDVAVYKLHDCSGRTCPGGPAWTDVPTAAYVAHAAAECSNKGTCNRATGICQCYSGFSGDKCQRRDCLNDCSGHGRCVSIKKMATLSDALPLSAKTTYAGDEETTRWDQDMVYGCVCDSSWGVGLGSGQTQQPEWFGPDCSLRRCPSGDNPMTRADETNCTNVTAAGGYGVGRAGNLCHVDCADRGSCDHETGECNCWTGAYGHDCTLSSALAM